MKWGWLSVLSPNVFSSSWRWGWPIAESKVPPGGSWQARAAQSSWEQSLSSEDPSCTPKALGALAMSTAVGDPGGVGSLAAKQQHQVPRVGKQVQGAGISQSSLQDLGLCRNRGKGFRRGTDLPPALALPPLHSPHYPPRTPTHSAVPSSGWQQPKSCEVWSSP